MGGEKLKAVRKVIQESNPEIMEMKLGCEFDDIGTGGHGIYLGLSHDTSSYGDGKLLHKFFKDDGCISQMGRGEIHLAGNNLGRRITLEDILISLEKHTGVSADEFASADKVTCKGNVLWDTDFRIMANWNLRKTLDDQSEETISWLHEVLVK